MMREEADLAQSLRARNRNEIKTSTPDRIRRNRRFLHQRHNDGRLLRILTLLFMNIHSLHRTSHT